MVSRFLTFINEQNLFLTHQRILLAVSGGLDSMAMATLFAEAKLQFGIAHCNFALRGQDSEGDEALVRTWALEHDVVCFVKNFDTKQYASLRGVSTQIAARELRYQWFEELRQAEGFDYIATAHHHNDSLETVLLNLVRGTGIAGLHGILPKNGRIIRPLLFANRSEIEDFVKNQQVSWREDSSNQTDDYQRNFVRHQVVPLLKQLNSNWEETMRSTLEKLRGTEQIFQEKIRQTQSECWHETGDVIRIQQVVIRQQLAPALQLHELIKKLGFSYEQCQQMLTNKTTGKQFFSETHWLVADRAQWVITPRETLQETIEINEVTQLSWLPVEQISPSDFLPTADVNTTWIDADKIQFPLIVRPWQQGDWFCPIGLGGKQKKISDLLIDKKIPLNLKPRIRVLCSKGQIVWVMGLRADERFKISSSTQQILRICLNEKP
ncbi:MAG: tRNA lysidine(34) synthetase TilS [Spirosomataceae bacterium]